ncbi:hypothetical protein NDU88_006529 [Pleurodeles waltl]|uniref:Uncharacterized protein n=1 Tax=Pleurodeles waltl TaxID=8319 RepID=A0AAV7WCU5_PLEWA|nr:hypothetical protein NDU88_006529 [Pleurodeles waltl]
MPPRPAKEPTLGCEAVAAGAGWVGRIRGERGGLLVAKVAARASTGAASLLSRLAAGRGLWVGQLVVLPCLGGTCVAASLGDGTPSWEACSSILLKSWSDGDSVGGCLLHLDLARREMGHHEQMDASQGNTMEQYTNPVVLPQRAARLEVSGEAAGTPLNTEEPL